MAARFASQTHLNAQDIWTRRDDSNHIAPCGKEAKTIKRKTIALLLVLSICLFLLPVGAAAEEEPIYYHLVVNDKYPLDLPQPIRVGGTIYVPYTVFDRDSTGVNLGITCVPGQSNDSRTLTLASIGGMLTFDINAQTCTDMEGGYHRYYAVVRNGKIYVPLSGVVNYFKQYMTLEYAQRTTRYGLLIRIYNGNASLDNDRFMEVAADSMRSAYNKYLSSLEPNPIPTTPEVTTPLPVPSDDPEGEAGEDSKGKIQVYFALQYNAGGHLSAMLDTLGRYGTQVLLLFRPEDLVGQADLVRRAVGEGHVLGLIPTGTTPEEAVQSLAEGNSLLERIAWTRTHIAFLPSGAEDVAAALVQGGWRIWTENVSPVTGEESLQGAASRVLKSTAQKRSYAKIRLDDSAAASGALTRILASLRADRYSIRLAVESELS